MIISRKVINSITFNLFCLILTVIMMYPVLWLVSSSFKDNMEIFNNAGSLIPEKIVFHNYVEGWKGFGKVTFITFFKNSLIISILSTISTVVSSAVVAFGFARVEFKGRKFWFVIMLLTIMLPYQVLMIPQYIIFNKLGWLNTFLPLIIPKLMGVPFFIFLMMQFIQTIPRELDEAAVIDGCNQFSIFTRIIVPLLIPAIFTSAIFSFYWSWADFLGPVIYLSKTRLYPIPLALKMFSDPNTLSNWGAMFAMSVLSLVPVMIIFLLFQKYIVEGISTSGLKG